MSDKRLDTSRTYTTRDGRKARIFYAEGDIVGPWGETLFGAAERLGDAGGWLPEAWLPSGRTSRGKAQYFSHPTDIIDLNPDEQGEST